MLFQTINCSIAPNYVGTEINLQKLWTFSNPMQISILNLFSNFLACNPSLSLLLTTSNLSICLRCMIKNNIFYILQIVNGIFILIFNIYKEETRSQNFIYFQNLLYVYIRLNISYHIMYIYAYTFPLTKIRLKKNENE